MPRGLIFLAALWLVGSWVASIGLITPVHASSPSYEPGVRMMLQSVVLGFMIAWPLLRLSQSADPAPVRHLMLDMIVLLALMQVVVWLPRLLTSWLVIRTAAVDALLAGWVVLVGAIVAAALGTNSYSTRTLAMLLCVVLCLLGPLMAWLGLHVALNRPELATLGPFMSVRELTAAGSTPPRPDQWRGIGIVWLMAGAMWAAVLVRAAVSGAKSRHRASDRQSPAG
jgi:hypothetical protein